MKSIIENSDGTFTIDGKTYAEVGMTTVQSNTIETKELIFLDLVKDLERKEDRVKYPDRVLWFNKNGEGMFEHNEENGIMWCSITRVWSVFVSRFNMNYYDVQEFMNGMVEKHFKLKGVTTIPLKGVTTDYTEVAKKR